MFSSFELVFVKDSKGEDGLNDGFFGKIEEDINGCVRSEQGNEGKGLSRSFR